MPTDTEECDGTAKRCPAHPLHESVTEAYEEGWSDALREHPSLDVERLRKAVNWAFGKNYNLVVNAIAAEYDRLSEPVA